MDRLTKLEIQRALLAGRELVWINASGKPEVLELKDAAQRRLFAYILRSAVRDPKGLSEEFVSGISTAYAAENDPASETGETAPTARTGPWRLQKIETTGFGGINICNGPAFSYDLDRESLIVTGPNGSGKSSLLGAILWAMTGERPRDNANARPEECADVYDDDNHKIGIWPPIACYPDTVAGLTGDPIVVVTLTFVDAAGTTALVERRLENGQITLNRDEALQVPEVLIETGLLMPSRMPQIRFEKGHTPLTRAIQSLTGLDDLIDIGTLVDGLCHRSREYLSTNEKQFQQYKALFESALAEAQRSIKPTGETIEAFRPKDTNDENGPFAQLGKKLRARAAELTLAINDDLVTGLNLTSANVHRDVAGAITIAQEVLAAGLDALPTWKALSALGSALTEEVTRRLRSAVDAAEAALTEAIALDERAQNDTRLQLKAVAAHWQEANRGASELTDCPLCEKTLDNMALKAEIEALRRAGETARRQLNDNLNAIQAGLTASLPCSVAPKFVELALLVPRQALLSDLKDCLVAKPRVKNALATFARLATEALSSAPNPELAMPENSASASDTIARVRAQIAAVRRLLTLDQWRSKNAAAWKDWWRQAVGADPLPSSKEDEAGRDTVERETLTQHLARLSHAIGEAEPYRLAADALGRAWTSGREASRYQKTQLSRQKIATQLAPLKSLGGFAEAQARFAIESLSEEISLILKRMHMSERLAFKSANLHRKTGLQVQGGFVDSFKIDATLVANTSWLRAVLWAFLFALRNEAVKQLGNDTLPLLVMDDPQSTFDAEHRLRWAMEIVALQKSTIPTQVILASHDVTFVELIKNVDGIVGREAIIVSAGPELGHVGLFEGAALERIWRTTQDQNTPNAAEHYISEVRKYAEALLRLMLRGHTTNVVGATNGLVVGTARTKLQELHMAKLAPWDKSEFSTLLGHLDKGNPAVKYLEMAHHAGGTGPPNDG